MTEISQTTKFCIRLLLILLIAFAVHYLILMRLNLPPFNDKIVLAYTLNYIIAAGIFFAMIYFKDILKGSLGFLFMGSSGVKFLVFFIFFYPEYNLDEITSKTEFSAFFIPYAICLFVEVFYLVRILNKT